MPLITYNKKDLQKLVGKKLGNEQLEEVVSLIKPGVEEQTDSEIKLEVTPDRPDLFGVEGLARAIRNYLEIKNNLQKFLSTNSTLEIKVDSVPIRPFIAAAIVRNVSLTDDVIKSLMNIQEVLHATIGRNRRKVAIGVHDFDKIIPPISYSGVSRDSKMIPLDFENVMTLREVLENSPKGKMYGNLISSAKLWPVFEDAQGIFSFPPVINSERTRVTEKTKNLFIDVTGLDKAAINQALNILVTNLAERGCKIEYLKLKLGKKSEITPNLQETVIEVDYPYLEKMIGVSLSKKDIIQLLQRMGYSSVINGEKIEVVIPPYRADILHQVDVIEDVAYAYGLNNLTPQLPNVATYGKALELERTCEKIRHLLIGMGFQETINFVMSNPLEQFDKMNVSREKVVEIQNPVSENYTCLRSWMLPSLMKILSVNKHVAYPQNIFEVGDVVLISPEEETRTKSLRKVCGVIAHSKSNFAEAKGVVDTFLKNFGINYSLQPYQENCYINGRAARIISNKKIIGSFGEVHPQVLENWEIEVPVASFELFVEDI